MWNVVNRDKTFSRETTLWLEYEVAGSIVGDEYDLAEYPADLMLEEYVRQVDSGKLQDANGLPEGHRHITWSIHGSNLGGELAPFQPDRWSDMPEHEDFLTFFQWPKSAVDGVKLNFLQLPVRDMAWNKQQRDRGGFIQEATGWKPAAFQPTLWLPGLFSAFVLYRNSQ